MACFTNMLTDCAMYLRAKIVLSHYSIPTTQYSILLLPFNITPYAWPLSWRRLLTG